MKKTLDLEPILKKLVDKIVAVANPERIILFGSAARGERGPDSDLDVLVVKDGDYKKNRRAAKDIYRNLFGIGLPVDVIVVTPAEIEEYRDCPYSIISPALREGREIYHA
ncbi:MAG TPA: nucleotidyltransferase domain-containing protein [Bacillota bacterium]|nr:nucleotidyltransferase domain-containing protein [Bacillota bacterium]